MNLGPKLPCKVCGRRDVDVLAAIPRLYFESPHSHRLQVIHADGRRCWLDAIPGPIGATTKRMMPRQAS